MTIVRDAVITVRMTVTDEEALYDALERIRDLFTMDEDILYTVASIEIGEEREHGD